VYLEHKSQTKIISIRIPGIGSHHNCQSSEEEMMPFGSKIIFFNFALEINEFLFPFQNKKSILPGSKLEFLQETVQLQRGSTWSELLYGILWRVHRIYYPVSNLSKRTKL
jgi:hypothetical protein